MYARSAYHPFLNELENQNNKAFKCLFRVLFYFILNKRIFLRNLLFSSFFDTVFFTFNNNLKNIHWFEDNIYKNILKLLRTALLKISTLYGNTDFN